MNFPGLIQIRQGQSGCVIKKMKILKGRSKNFLATLDSRSETIEESVQLAVRKENFPLNPFTIVPAFFLNHLSMLFSELETVF